MPGETYVGRRSVVCLVGAVVAATYIYMPHFPLNLYGPSVETVFTH